MTKPTSYKTPEAEAARGSGASPVELVGGEVYETMVITNGSANPRQSPDRKVSDNTACSARGDVEGPKVAIGVDGDDAIATQIRQHEHDGNRHARRSRGATIARRAIVV